MLIMNTSEYRMLRSAELNAGVGYVCALPVSDAWAAEWNHAWIAWCANINDCDWRGQGWGWSSGCAYGQRIGTRLRGPQGVIKALACQLPE